MTFSEYATASIAGLIVLGMFWEIWKGERPRRPSGFRLVEEARESRRRDVEQTVREAGE